MFYPLYFSIVIVERVISRVFDEIIQQTVNDAMTAAEKQLEVIYRIYQILNMYSQILSITYSFRFFSHFPLASYVKKKPDILQWWISWMSCSGEYLEFTIDTKNTHFIKNHPRNIPAKFSVKWISDFRVLRIILKHFPIGFYAKFVLLWWTS